MKLLGVLMMAAAVAIGVGASLSPADEPPQGDEGSGAAEEAVPFVLKLYRFVHPLGIATYTSLWITFLLGFLKFKCCVRRINMRWHYGFAILTLVLATLHAAIVIGLGYL